MRYGDDGVEGVTSKMQDKGEWCAMDECKLNVKDPSKQVNRGEEYDEYEFSCNAW